MRVAELLQYLGPNRRSERTGVEWKFELSSEEIHAVAEAAATGYAQLRKMLGESGSETLRALAEGDSIGLASSPDNRPARSGPAIEGLLDLVARIALALQRSGGHKVEFHVLSPCKSPTQWRMFYESEHADVALNAGELALRLCRDAIPGLQWQADPALPGEDLQHGLQSFLQQAQATALPLETQALIAAAARLDIPCVKLERAPYAGLQGEFRIRPNGLLRLGHSCFQRIMDGSLCIDRNASLIPLLFDRSKVHETLTTLKLPVARQDSDLRHLVTAKRAVRAADRLGYPVVLRSIARSPIRANQKPRPLALNSGPEVQRAFDESNPGSPGVMVEEYRPGQTVHLLVADGKFFCALDAQTSQLLNGELHSSLPEMAENIARQLDVGLLLVTVISTDLSKSLHEASGVVTDLNPAPDLGSLLGVTPHLLQQAAEAFLHWLFPEGRQSRIPLVAVTGTNGKTTTCRMIARIMQTAGFKPGLATTSGVYINGELLREGDHAGTEGHHLVFESRKVDMGVLETARGGVATSGFMFDHCDVAVCLNVTEDHLGQYELHTVQDLAAIKRSILLRARKAIVINADYATCLDMLPIAGPPQIYAATLMHSLNEVRDLVGAEAWVCLCEFVGDEKWIVLHGPAGERLAVTAANDIPACFDGLARFNISNAQHAVCASHALGISTELIGAALAGFDSSYENNPGRLNIYRGLPFTVVMDYAHNRDGMESILQFLTDLQLKGRKLLLYAVTGDRSLEMLKEFSQLPVATFDHFICRNYTDDRGRLHPEFPSLMKQALMQAGVSEECITLVDVPEDGPGVALSLARPGDLLMMCPGSEELADMWNKILAFVPDFEPGDAQASTKH